MIRASEHKSWGDSIAFVDFDTRKIVGWLTPIPEVGETVAFEMESGRTALFRLKTIHKCGDPEDMFFADAEDIGYEGEL